MLDRNFLQAAKNIHEFLENLSFLNFCKKSGIEGISGFFQEFQ
jgi:DNA primase